MGRVTEKFVWTVKYLGLTGAKGISTSQRFLRKETILVVFLERKNVASSDLRLVTTISICFFRFLFDIFGPP